MAAICLVIGLGFLVLAREGGLFVFLLLVGVIALLGAVAFLVPRARRRRISRAPREAFVSTTAAYVGGRFHSWTMLGARLDSAQRVAGQPRLVEIVYSYPAKNGRQECSLRVAVPAGLEAAGAEVVRQLTANAL